MPNITHKSGSFDQTYGYSGSMSRNTPALAGNKIVITDYHSGYVFCFKDNGDLVWAVNVETHPYARMADSAIIINNKIYLGTTSFEEAAPAIEGPSYQFSFRGSFMAINLDNGAIIWRQYMAPITYTGNSIWSSAPAIDKDLNMVVITTGNNYGVPPNVSACINNIMNANGTDIRNCTDPMNRSDSIVGMDLDTGVVLVSRSVAEFEFDAYNLACNYNLPSCPIIRGTTEPDSDFSQGAMLINTRTNGTIRYMICAGSKNGKFYCIDRITGSLIWHTRVGPASVQGGIMFGQAYDGNSIFVSDSNGLHIPFIDPFGRNVTGGIVCALDPNTGTFKWCFPEPTSSRFYGPMSVNNGVLFTGSLSTTDLTHFGLDTLNGDLLWGMKTVGSFAAPVFYKNLLLVGEGYGLGAALNSNPTKVYIMEVPSQYSNCDNYDTPNYNEA